MNERIVIEVILFRVVKIDFYNVVVIDVQVLLADTFMSVSEHISPEWDVARVNNSILDLKSWKSRYDFIIGSGLCSACPISEVLFVIVKKCLKIILFKVKTMYCCKPMSFFRSEISLIFNISWNMPYIDPLLWIWRILKNNEKKIVLYANFGSKRVRCCEDLFCNVLHLFSLNARSPFEQLWI